MARLDHGVIRDLTNPIDLQKLFDRLQAMEGYLSFKVTEGKVEVTDATTTTVLTLPLEDNKTSQVVVDAVARRTGGSAGSAGDGASYRLLGTFYRVSAGAATQIGSTTTAHSAEAQAAWALTLAVSGNDVLVRFAGAANNNVTVAALATLQTV